MKILFVYKGEGSKIRNSVIDDQVESLVDQNIDIIKFPLITSGIKSYFTEYFRLLKFLRNNTID